MLTTISDEMSVNRLVRPINQTFRLIVNVLSPDDQRRRGFSLQTIGYMQTRGRITRAIQSFRFLVLGWGSTFSFELKTANRTQNRNREPNPEPEHELRTQNSEQRTLDRCSLIAAPLVSCNRYRDRRVFRLPHPGDERENLGTHHGNAGPVLSA